MSGPPAYADRVMAVAYAKNLSVNYIDAGRYFAKGDDCRGKVVEGDEATLEFLVAHEQLAEAIEPAMADLDDPAPCLLGRIVLLDVGFGTSTDDMRDVAVALDSAKVLGPTVARVGAQMLVSPMRRPLAPDDARPALQGRYGAAGRSIRCARAER